MFPKSDRCVTNGGKPRLDQVMRRIGFALIPLLLTGSLPGQTPAWEELASRYNITPNIPYVRAAGEEPRLDVFAPQAPAGAAPAPVVLYIHGGGWTGGDKNAAVLRLLPYLRKGWGVVNVNYRLGAAPAAVEDCRCALKWLVRNAPKFRFDASKIVITGDSAGSHLALVTGFLTKAAGFDANCPADGDPRAAAIVNWFGATDVRDLIQGPNRRPFAVRWLEGVPKPDELARRMSPLEHVRAGLPPVFTVHGDEDGVVPHEHAARLHRALDAAHVPNRLLTLRGGGHGGFRGEEMVQAFAAISEFLARQGIR
jgi:acetyl esterase/lipase